MTEKKPFLMNAWYAACLSSDIEDQAMFTRRLLDTPVLFYRTQDGEVAAIHDRCPHRFVPLSRGKREGDDVICPYHALRFDSAGQCKHNPHGNQHIPEAACVRTFATLEKYGFVWIWMGDQPADISQLPDWGELTNGHENSVAYTYMPMKAHYELIIDNVMDLSHIDHVHGEIITTRGKLSPMIPQIKEENNQINSRWEWEQTPAMLIFNQFLPDPDASARHFFDITWSAPGNIQLSVGCTQDPEGKLDLNDSVGQYDLHTTTPETEDSTHYFFATRRNHVEEDGEYNKMKIQAMHDAFVQEDGPIIEAVHEEMGTSDFFSLNPVLLSNDIGPVKVRRLLQALKDEEASRASE